MMKMRFFRLWACFAFLFAAMLWLTGDVSGLRAQGAGASGAGALRENGAKTGKTGAIAAEAGRKLVVSTVERPPFTFFHPDGKVTGFSADLWIEIARRNGWAFVWKREESFPAMIEAVAQARSDAAIANISITSEREKLLDFSQPVYDSGLQILVRNNGGSVSIFKLIWRSGALQLIGAAILVLLIIAHILWFFERNTPNSRHDYFRDDYLGGVWDAFWWAFIIMTMGGFENEVPHSIPSRLLAMFWIVVSLFFVSTLTAKITTSLTVDQLTGDINSYNDLLGRKVGVGEGSSMARFLDRKNIPYRKYRDFKAALAALEKGRLDATIADAPVAQYYVSHEGRGKVALAGPVFRPDKFGIALPTGSPLLEVVNTSLLAMREDGAYEKLLAKWFGRRD
jgi:polar amino acid transport system substrate-binding protein